MFWRDGGLEMLVIFPMSQFSLIEDSEYVSLGLCVHGDFSHEFLKDTPIPCAVSCLISVIISFEKAMGIDFPFVHVSPPICWMMILSFSLINCCWALQGTIISILKSEFLQKVSDGKPSKPRGIVFTSKLLMKAEVLDVSL